MSSLNSRKTNVSIERIEKMKEAQRKVVEELEMERIAKEKKEKGKIENDIIIRESVKKIFSRR